MKFLPFFLIFVFLISLVSVNAQEVEEGFSVLNGLSPDSIWKDGITGLQQFIMDLNSLLSPQVVLGGTDQTCSDNAYRVGAALSGRTFRLISTTKEIPSGANWVRIELRDLTNNKQTSSFFLVGEPALFDNLNPAFTYQWYAFACFPTNQAPSNPCSATCQFIEFGDCLGGYTKISGTCPSDLYTCCEKTDTTTPPPSTSEKCVDHDGLNYKLASSVDFSPGGTGPFNFPDVCDAIQVDVLRERICDVNDEVDTREKNCKDFGSDWTCKEGACIIGEPRVTDTCGLSGGFRQSECEINQEEILSRNDAGVCCITRPEDEQFCLNPTKKVGEAFCEGETSNLCAFSSTLDRPVYFKKDCTLFEGCSDSTGHCREERTGTDCIFEGKAYRLGDGIGDEFCVEAKTPAEFDEKQRKTVSGTNGTQCIVEVTERTRCNFGCIGGVCLTSDGTLPVEGICSKPNGASCTLLPVAGIDDTQPSDECRSGICVDVTGVGGRCGTKTQVAEGVVVEPHPTCVDLGTAKGEEPFDINKIGCTVGEAVGIKTNPCVWGWIILVVGTLVGLSIIGKIGK